MSAAKKPLTERVDIDELQYKPMSPEAAKAMLDGAPDYVKARAKQWAGDREKLGGQGKPAGRA